ncbi:hypothetical protein Fmac_016269 [Flemingia macrophylla]|uniref:Disease resistance RPP13-like protein 1 n=1 Tax=Flemingia macrophylla TaxID=520843 RepID=A0ABD1MH36_9FABA
MAAEFVGGALLSAFLQTAVNRLASQQVVDFFRRRKLDEKLLIRLKGKLRSINAVVNDAELKQIQNQLVRDWLFDVKDAVHDAEDVLDEIDYELTRCQVEAESEPQTFLHKVPYFFNITFSSFNSKIDSAMTEVLDKLDELLNQKDHLGLKETTYSGVGSGSKVALKLETTSLVVESGFYGRDDDKEMIYEWLTSETATDNHNRLAILSIVGMGGVGKTALAQHVYNDPRIEEADFGIRAWVCVSDEFSVLTVTRAILEKVSKSKYDGDLEMLHGGLKKELSGKRFLLVLDDVWNENQEKWEAVQTPLNYGAPGSRILVTTRSEKVAFTMRSSKVHQLKQLQEEHCWKVFSLHAFQDNRPQLDVELEEIARKIVDKCKGLPLALKTMGSLLRTKLSIMEWKSVLMSEIWDLPKDDSNIIPALFLSYHYLPSCLKRCFAYCALFPKDYEFNMKDLIFLWMAENFLQCPQQSKGPEEVGEQYFYDLLSRSFFQRSSKSLFVMHDLLNDLAKYVSGDVCFRFGVDKAKSIRNTTRHFSVVISGDLRDFDGFGRSYDFPKRLHTFIPMQGARAYVSWQCMISNHELFSKFKSLHVLSLSRCVTLKDVPDTLGELKHLRSLDLSRTHIKRLPDSTCLLYNLQILKLNFCDNLEELPSKLHKLTNLRCLEFKYTEVRKMPMHLGRLKNLRVLSLFFVGNSSEFGIEQLGGLNLHEGISIVELDNIENPSYALAANLKNKTHLNELELEWRRNHIPDDPRKENEVLENLQPSKHLTDLSISNYAGTQIPSWLFDNSLSNLKSLRFVDCKYLLLLPPLGNLPFLKVLSIEGLDGIVSVGTEFYGSSSSSFKSLERLEFFKMKEWEEWECQVAAFPHLQFLHIRGCPKLKGIPEQLRHIKYVSIHKCGILNLSRHWMQAMSRKRVGLFVSNTSLCIYDCPHISIPMRCCYYFLGTLHISNSSSLTALVLDVFPNLHSLQLSQCSNLQMISQDHTHNNLNDLYISDCPQFESFPKEGISSPSLATFRLERLENLKLLPKGMHILLPSLTELKILDCPEVEKFSDGGLPSNIECVGLSSLKLIISLKGALTINTSLEILSIEKVDVESFPDEGFLPPCLTSLNIRHCSNLKKLDYKGLCQLSSLKILVIYRCNNLQHLPEEGLPKTISTLEIKHCKLLIKRCQKGGGEDWRKIAHIKNLYIGIQYDE